MNFQVSTWSLVFSIAIVISKYPLPTLSFDHPGYLSRDVTNYYNPYWMYRLNDNTKLSDLSIPGTHDSVSLGNWGPIYQTQTMQLRKQFEAGIRFFDFACRRNYTDDPSIRLLYVYSGLVYLDYDLDHVLEILKELLTEFPSEAIIIRLSIEGIRYYQHILFQFFEEFFQRHHESIWHGDRIHQNNLTLGEIRGKFVIMHNIDGIKTGFFHSDDLDVQDDNLLSTNWSLYDKWLKVKEHLNKANSRNSSHKIFVNWLVGWGGSFPYFVASGHSDSGHAAPQLLTGLTTPGFSDYFPDFPRVSCFWVFCSIAFKGTNMLASEYIRDHAEFNYVGIIISDFPGPGLIDSVIAVNRLSVKPEHVSGVFFHVYSFSVSDFFIDLDLGSMKLVLWEYTGNPNQIWQFDLMKEDNSYAIRYIARPELVVTWDVENGTSHLSASRYYGSTNQRWILEREAGNAILLKSLHDASFVIQPDSESITKGTKIIVSNQREMSATASMNRLFILRTVLV